MNDDELSDYLYAQRFYFLAEQSLNIIKKSMAETLRRHGLTHTQHLILLVLRYATLSGRPAISTDIAFLLGLEKHSVTAVVDKLEEAGIIERVRSQEDRRAIFLSLTVSGRELAERVQGETMRAISVVPEHASDEFARMCGFLETLRNHIAETSGQPGDSYSRAYESLLIDGQAAFRRQHA